MKQFFTLALAATAIAASAATDDAGNRIARPALKAPVEISATNPQLMKRNTERHEFTSLKQGSSRSGDEVIYEAPGTPELYKVEWEGFTYSYGYTWGESATYISRDGDNLYIKDPCDPYKFGTWIEGTVEGNKVTVELPQLVAVDDYFGDEYKMVLMEKYYYESDGETYIDYDPVMYDHSVTYTIADDGTISLDLDPMGDDGLYPDIIFGMICDWYGEGNYVYWYDGGETQQIYTPSEMKADVEVPAGVELDPNWIYRSAEESGTYVTAGYMSVGFDGDDVYFVGIYPNLPDAAIKGTIQDGKVVIPSGQFMGYDDEESTMITCYVYDYNWSYERDLVMDFDTEKRIMTIDSSDEDGWSLIFYGELYSEMYIDDPMFMYQAPGADCAAPQNPEFSEFDENWLCVTWFFPMYNVNGYLMDTNNMWYNVYVDGNLFTFNTYDYYLFPEDMTDIPYNFDPEYDLYVRGTRHRFYFYEDDMETQGVIMFYQASDGKVYTSDFVNVDLYSGEVIITSGVESMTMSEQPVSAAYYDLQGRKVTNPESGIYVRVIKYADGTNSVQKVAIR
ncbi:MAG: hypothetical protein LIP03_15115 [Bacteroidales bacterium]|nr:hypothetical protein [Bacteroidales bacterium]